MLYTFELNHMPRINLIGHSVCSKEWKLPLRTIQDYEMIIVYQGKATFYSNNSEYNLFPGSYLVIHPNEPHSAVTWESSPCRFYYLHFSMMGPLEMIEENIFLQQVLDLMKSGEYTNAHSYWVMPETFLQRIYYSKSMFLDNYRDEIFTLLERSLLERNKAALNSQLVISTYLTQILILLTRLVFENKIENTAHSGYSEMPRLFQKAVFYIHENYLNPLTIKEVCSHVGVSPQYLSRLFKKNLGCSQLKYINQLRIRYAKDLMRTTTMSMKEITYAIGLENPFYFSRLFKQLEGIQPTKFIKGLESKSNE